MRKSFFKKYRFGLQKVVKNCFWWHFQISDLKIVFFSFLNFSFRWKFFLGRKSWFSRTFRRILCGMIYLYVDVEIDRELVRLITLIGLSNLSTNITSPKTVKKFSRTTFWWCRQKMFIFDVLEIFISKITYNKLY